ncbi:unnamed protein product, partial [Scytosiphon promiscuus]
EEEAEEPEAEEGDRERWTNGALQIAISRQARIVLDTLPKIAADGTLGPAPWMEKIHRPPKFVAAAFKKRFPHAPICRPVDSPEMRAEAAMHPSQATPAMRKRAEKGESMDLLLQEAAMAVFATTHVEFALYVHEVVFFAELVRIPRFQASGRLSKGVTTPSGGTAVRMICPGCKSNKNVKPPGTSGQGYSIAGAKRIRAVHDVGRVVVPLTGRYSCAGSGCPLVLESAKNAAKRQKAIIADDGWDEATIGKYCPNGATFNTMDDRYMRFVVKHQGPARALWPGWKFNRGTLVSTPSVAVLNTIYNEGHVADKEHMLREIHSQCGGEFLNMDGTWRIGSRVIDFPDCLFFLLGEDAKVHAYGAVNNESKEEIYPLLKRYAERRRRHGTLLALKWLYDDLCCKGANDVTKGWILELF